MTVGRALVRRYSVASLNRGTITATPQRRQDQFLTGREGWRKREIGSGKQFVELARLQRSEKGSTDNPLTAGMFERVEHVHPERASQLLPGIVEADNEARSGLERPADDQTNSFNGDV